MSSTFAESLRSAIEVTDNSTAVELLESRMKDGIASEEERLLCGVLLLMPPLADYEAAANIFCGMLSGRRGFEAAVWDAYRFAVLLPDGDRPFEAVLRSSSRSAVAAHMLSMVAASCDDMVLALTENRKSRALRLFPFNITEALKCDPDLQRDARNDLWQIACDLIVSRSAELDPAVHTIEGALRRRWDNLIIGTRMTSQLWGEYGRAAGLDLRTVGP
jgi:hypothetical protein